MTNLITQQLRDARQRQNKTLEDVHLKTGASVKVLEGLEAGQFDLVEPKFTRLALRDYAEHLKLDLTPLLAAFDEEFAPRSPRELPTEPGFALLSLTDRAKLIGLGVAGLVFIIILISAFGNGEDQTASNDRSRVTPATQIAQSPLEPIPRTPAPRPEPKAPPARQATVSRPGPTPEPAPEPESEVSTAKPQASDEPVAPVEPLASVEPVASAEPVASVESVTEPAAVRAAENFALSNDSTLVMRVEAIDEVWFQVEGDGRILFTGTVKPGFKSRDWHAEQQFNVVSGKPHALRHWLQGELLGEEGRLGTANRVLRFRATHQGVELLTSVPTAAQPPQEPSTSVSADSLR